MSKLSFKKMKEQFNLRGLQKEISRRAGFKVLIKGELKKNPRGGVRVEFTSKPLKGRAGLLDFVYKEFRIADFGSSFHEEDETYGPNIWIGVNFEYEYLRGGKNGASWFDAFYCLDNGKWIFN